MFVKGHCSHSSRCGCFCRNWIFLSHFWAVGQYCHSKCSERKLRPREMRQLPWGQKDILWHKTAVSALPLGYAFSFHKISFMQKVLIQNLAGFQPAFWRSFCIVCSSVYFAVHYLRVFSYNLQNIFFLRLFLYQNLDVHQLCLLYQIYFPELHPEQLLILLSMQNEGEDSSMHSPSGASTLS